MPLFSSVPLGCTTMGQQRAVVSTCRDSHLTTQDHHRELGTTDTIVAHRRWRSTQGRAEESPRCRRSSPTAPPPPGRQMRGSIPACAMGICPGPVIPWGFVRVQSYLGDLSGSSHTLGICPGPVIPWGFVRVQSYLGDLSGSSHTLGICPGPVIPWGFVRVQSYLGDLSGSSHTRDFNIALGICPGPVIPETSTLALQWLPCRVPGDKGSELGPVGSVSEYCDWARYKV